MSKRAEVYLADMLQYGRRILAYTAGERGRLLEDRILRDAVIRNFEIVGEAATRVPAEVRDRHPEIPWSKIIGFRNVLIHGYRGLDLQIVGTRSRTTFPACSNRWKPFSASAASTRSASPNEAGALAGPQPLAVRGAWREGGHTPQGRPGAAGARRGGQGPF